MFDLNEIKELIKIVDESSVEELEIENEGTRLYISKPKAPHTVHTLPAVAPQQPVQQAITASEATNASTGKPQADEAKTAAAADGENSGLHEITSPMVGTFYAAPSPGAEPFVSKGDKVKENTVVCIVEAMKLMNEIEAEVSGEIVEVLVDNAQLVEFGQPLFLVKPD